MPTKFKSSTERGRMTRGQAVIYGVMILLSVATPVPYVYGWWTARHPVSPATASASEVRRASQEPQPEPTRSVQVQEIPRHLPASQIEAEETPAMTPTRSEEGLTNAQAQTFTVPAPAPDPATTRWQAWRTMHDAYANQVKARMVAAKTDGEKGQIQRDILAWQRNNPEPPRPATTPARNTNGEEQIRIR